MNLEVFEHFVTRELGPKCDQFDPNCCTCIAWELLERARLPVQQKAPPADQWTTAERAAFAQITNTNVCQKCIRPAPYCVCGLMGFGAAVNQTSG